VAELDTTEPDGRSRWRRDAAGADPGTWPSHFNLRARSLVLLRDARAVAAPPASPSRPPVAPAGPPQPLTRPEA
jgi:hypothetical protein